jgi:polyphosphate glucokinase
MADRVAIGVDVGGSAIKVAAVDLDRGELASDRVRLATPNPSTPDAVIGAIDGLVAQVRDAAHVPADAPIGVGVPTVVLDGVAMLASNIDVGWIGFEIVAALTRVLGRPVTVLNDADAAGLAEMRFGAGRGRDGVVLVLTLGTGVGSGLFLDGRLVPNTEFGQMEIRGRPAEDRSAASARTRHGLSWEAWAHDLDEHLDRIDQLVWPNVIILGGGISQDADRFIPLLTCRVPVIPATLLNDAGIVGAALAASERFRGS